MPKPAVRLTAEVSRRLCRGLAAGQGLKRLCRGPEMPSRRQVQTWTHERPAFARRLAAARARGGLAGLKGRPGSYCDRTAERIFERLAGGQPLYRICQSPAFPSLTTVYKWRRTRPAFRAAITLARECHADALCDQGWEICLAATPETARATDKALRLLRWQVDVLADRR